METEPEPEPEPDANGFLKLRGNPGPWIERSPRSSHLLVKHLELDFSRIVNEEHEIEESIDQLALLTHLTILNANESFNCLPFSVATLHNLHFLKFERCQFQELPANIGLLKTNLTHLTIWRCNFRSLPEIVVTLSKLTCLDLSDCSSLSELTPSLGQLGPSLTELTLCRCNNILSLPKSFATLSNLTNLYLTSCDELTELPPSLGQLSSLVVLSLEQCFFNFLPASIASLFNLTSLDLSDCNSLEELPPCLDQLGSLKHIYLEECGNLKSLPNSMSNLLHLETLSIEGCYSLTQLPDNLKIKHLELINSSIKFIPRGLINLRHLTIDGCLNDIPNIFTNCDHLVNLQTLSLCSKNYYNFTVKFPDILEGLHELILLDIQDTTVKYLPWSILKLQKLRFLMLPWAFRLQTLPFHLNDSVLISIKGRHTRKTWKQLKQEIGVSDFLNAQGECPSILALPGYLSLDEDLRKWISDNNESRLLVKMLELESPLSYDVQTTKNSIGELRNLTHLFVTYGRYRDWVPNTIKQLKHFCLQLCDSKCHSVNLCKLSNLYTLDLIFTTTFPIKLDLPISLRCLSLQSANRFSLPYSLAKLSNLHTLELSGCYNIPPMPPLNVATLKINKIIESIPFGLRHLEILHVKRDCCDNDCDGNRLEHCLTQLVNLEMFSLTCYHIKSLPSMAGQRNLGVLFLKNCFSLKELLPDLEELVELHTLDISGTRIKSLPDSIIKLSKLQQLTLPKCFTQKLPSNLKESSIIDNTDISYYEHMGYYDADFETSSESSYEGNDDDEVGSVEGVNEAIAEDPTQGVIDGKTWEQNDFIAQAPRVSSSTMKRGNNENEIIGSSSKKMKQCHDAKEGEPNTDSTCSEKPSKQADGLKQNVSKGAAATMTTVEKPLWNLSRRAIRK